MTSRVGCNGGGLGCATTWVMDKTTVQAKTAIVLRIITPIQTVSETRRIGILGSFHETAKVVNSLSGETLCISVGGPTNRQLEFERCRILHTIFPPRTGFLAGARAEPWGGVDAGGGRWGLRRGALGVGAQKVL